MGQRALGAWRVTRDFLDAVERHALMSNAAATAFFLFFSIPPLVLALVALLGLIPLERAVGTTANELLGWIRAALEQVFPDETAGGITHYLALRAQPLFDAVEEFASVDLRERIQERLNRALPADAAGALGGLAADVLGAAHPGLLTASFLGIVWAASAATRASSRAMNVIYEVRRPNFLVRNLKSLGMTVFILLGFTVALLVMPLVQGLIQGVRALLGLGVWLAWFGGLVGWLAQAGLLLFIVLVLQRFGPRARTTVLGVLPGSVLTVVLWALLSLGLGLWTRFGWERYNATYGTLTGVIVVLLWCYLASAALLLGVELNAFRWRRSRPPEDSVGGDLETDAP